MTIFIIGAGFTGVQLAKRLISEKNDVVLIESNEETVRHVSNRLDCMVIQASGNNLETLQEAGIAKASALVAVTESDELNMITCSLVDSVYPHIIKIARVRNYDYYVNSSHSQNKSPHKRPLYGIDHMIYPDLEAAKAIVSAVEHGAVSDALEFDNSQYELTSIYIEKGSSLDGIAIQDIREIANCEFLLAYIVSNGHSSLPSGSTIIKADDQISLLTTKENLPLFLKLAGSQTKELKKVALIGAGRIGTQIAENLLEKQNKSLLSRFFGLKHNSAKNFIIIEKDRALANKASQNFPTATVYNADISDEGFIEEEGIEKVDLVITATSNHEANMINSAYFKSLGVSKTICLVTSNNYASIARKLGIDVAIPIKDVVVDSILSHLRGKSVTEVHTISEGSLEIIEFKITPTSQVVGKTLKEVAIAGQFLVLLLKKDQAWFIPGGDTPLQAENSLVCIVNSQDVGIVLERFGG